MATNPYTSFEEWKLDMDRVRSNPNDSQLLNHVKGRVLTSSKQIQSQVQDYLNNAAFVDDPISYGSQVAQKLNKTLVVRTKDDPWFYV